MTFVWIFVLESFCVLRAPALRYTRDDTCSGSWLCSTKNDMIDNCCRSTWCVAREHTGKLFVSPQTHFACCHIDKNGFSNWSNMLSNINKPNEKRCSCSMWKHDLPIHKTSVNGQTPKKPKTPSFARQQRRSKKTKSTRASTHNISRFFRAHVSCFIVKESTQSPGISRLNVSCYFSAVVCLVLSVLGEELALQSQVFLYLDFAEILSVFRRAQFNN